MYNDTIRITFDQPSHKYLVTNLVGDRWLDPSPVIGVTSILAIMAKDFLAPWASKLAADYMYTQLTATKSLSGLRALADEAKNQHRVKADVGKKAGHVGHALVEALALGKRVTLPSDPVERDMAMSVQKAYEAFTLDYPMEILGNEQIVYSRQYNYAGQYDRKARINGKLTIIDWKTTNTSRYNPDGIYAEYFAQGGGYAQAEEEMYGEKIDDIMIVNLPKDGGDYKVKRLSDMGLSMIDAKCYFLAAKQLYDLNKTFQWKNSN